MIHIAVIIMYRLILYDEEIYAAPDKTVNACGVVSDIIKKEKTSEITLKDVGVTKSFLYILNHLII